MSQLDLNDASLYYEVIGTGSPILFIQGIGVIGAGWGPQTEALSKGYQCLSFDNRGIGQSATSAPHLTVEQMANDAVALLDVLGWKSVHVVGHSMGGMIAQQLALIAPDRVASLSLLCTFTRGSQGARLTPWVLWASLRTRIGSRTMRRRAFLDMLFTKEYLAPLPIDGLAARLEPVIGRDLADQPAILMKQLKALGTYDRSGQLADLSHIPTLVVSATHDPIALPQYGILLSQLIPGSRYIEIPDASHGVTLQKPEQVNALLRDHFARSEKQ